MVECAWKRHQIMESIHTNLRTRSLINPDSMMSVENPSSGTRLSVTDCKLFDVTPNGWVSSNMLIRMVQFVVLTAHSYHKSFYALVVL